MSFKFLAGIGLFTVALTVVALLHSLGEGEYAKTPAPPTASAVLRAASSRDLTPVDVTTIRQVMKSFPPVVNVPISIPEISDPGVRDEEFVLGVEINGESRGYPVNMLGDPKHEILNDTLGGEPIGVTWCDQCQSPLVFSRKVGDKALTLFIPGKLVEMNMVIKDVETGSEWVQILGEAVSGPLKGRHLEMVPALWTDWKTWRKSYPKTTVAMLPRLANKYQHMPQYSEFAPEREYFESLQWGLAQDKKARSWSYRELSRQPVVNDEFADRDIVIHFDIHASTVNAFDREVDGRVLTFRPLGSDLTDDQTHSVWNPVTGQALRGPFMGSRLKPIPGIISLVRTWTAFHPKTETWAAR